MDIFTTKGIIDTDQLDVTDQITLAGNSREIVTEWRLKTTGEVVRRDGWVNMLVGQTISAAQAQI